MLRKFNKITARYRIRIMNTPGKHHESWNRHGDLIDAIARGDAEGAERMRKKAVLANIPLVEKTFEPL
jgi:DNA-binding GntR family transcriptional regulator